MEPIWLAFITGLTSGGISCLAVQGGLLASAVSGDKQTKIEIDRAKTNRFLQTTLFLLAKILSHAILGFLLGLVGASLILKPKTMGLMQIFIGLYLIATAARILNIHPLFRFTVIQPPLWTFRLLRKWSREPTWFAPIIMGFFTVLIPCGITQAMMVLAVASGSPFMAAGILTAFVIGTSPIFFLLGFVIEEFLRSKFFTYLASGVIIIFGTLSLNGGLVLRGSIFTIQNFYRAATTDLDSVDFNKGTVLGLTADGKQNAVIYVATNGYHSSINTLKAGIPVHLSLITNQTGGCARIFTIPEYDITKTLPVSGTETVNFTPQKTGTLVYACGMGMYTGSFTVIP